MVVPWVGGVLLGLLLWVVVGCWVVGWVGECGCAVMGVAVERGGWPACLGMGRGAVLA